MIVYLARDFPAFVMFASMELTDSMITTVLDIKRVENAIFHTMYIFTVILHAIDKQDIST